MDTQKHNYTLDLSTSKWTIQVSPSTNYGWFERNSGPDGGAGGGLWFAINDEGKTELVDYDGGYYNLPQQVAKALRDAGYYLDETFDPEPTTKEH